MFDAFPGVRRLAADYAYHFRIRRAIFLRRSRRARRLGRRCSRARRRIRGAAARSLSVVAAQQQRRQAPARGGRGSGAARRCARPSRSSPASRRDSSAVRCSRCSRRSRRFKLADTGDAGTSGAGGRRVLGRGRRSRLGRGAVVHGARRTARAAHRRPSPLTRPTDPAPVGANHAGCVDSVGHRRARTHPAGDGIPPALSQTFAAAYAPGTGMADAFARWLEHVLGPRGLVVYDASDPASKPLAAGVFARELSTAGETGAPRGRSRAPTGRSAAITRRCMRRTTAWRSSASTARRRDHPPAGRRSSSSATQRLTRPRSCARTLATPGRVQPERAAASDRAGHALPDRLLCRRPQRARLSRPAARRSTSISACRCR